MNKKIYNPNDLIGLSDVANILGKDKRVTSVFLGRWKDRDPDFPASQIINGGAAYRYDEIKKYLLENGLVPDNQLPNLMSSGAGYTIKLVGRARTGKSTCISTLIKEKILYRELFSNSGSDCTQCDVRNIISRRDENGVTFKTNFGENVQISSLDINEEEKEAYEDMVSKATMLNNCGMALNNPYCKNFIKNIWELSDYIKKFEQRHKVNESQTYVEVALKGNKSVIDLLDENKLDFITLVDTPGVSGNVKASTSFGKVNQYIIMLNDANKDEAKASISEIIPTLKPYITSSDFTFVYRMNSYAEDDDEYNTYIVDEAKSAIAFFEPMFNELKGNAIINSGLSLLNIIENVLPFPVIQKRRDSFSENRFTKDFIGRIRNSIQRNSEAFLKQEFMDAVSQNVSAAQNLVKELLKKIPAYVWNGSYTKDNFISERHDRVATNDKYAVHNSVCTTYHKEKKRLYDIFVSYKVGDYPEKWQHQIVKYVYYALANSLTRDFGVANGCHPFEANPPLTMYGIESVFADEICMLGTDIPQRYTSVLKSNQITSNSWNYVYVPHNALQTEGYLKLTYVKKYLPYNRYNSEIHFKNMEDLILYRYTLGLRLYAEVNLLKATQMSDLDIDTFMRNYSH